MRAATSGWRSKVRRSSRAAARRRGGWARTRQSRSSARAKRVVLVPAQHAALDEVAEAVDAEEVLGDPEEHVEVAQAALAVLHVGLEEIARNRRHAGGGRRAPRSLGGHELGLGARDQPGEEAPAEVVVQIPVAPHVARFQHRGPYRHVLARQSEAIGDRAGCMTHVEPQIPHHVEQILDDLLAARGQLVGMQEKGHRHRSGGARGRPGRSRPRPRARAGLAVVGFGSGVDGARGMVEQTCPAAGRVSVVWAATISAPDAPCLETPADLARGPRRAPAAPARAPPCGRRDRPPRSASARASSVEEGGLRAGHTHRRVRHRRTRRPHAAASAPWPAGTRAAPAAGSHIVRNLPRMPAARKQRAAAQAQAAIGISIAPFAGDGRREDEGPRAALWRAELHGEGGAVMYNRRRCRKSPHQTVRSKRFGTALELFMATSLTSWTCWSTS